MDSGNSGGGGDDGGHGGAGDLYHNSSTHFNRITIQSNFFNPLSFSKPQIPNPNPNSIYDLNSLNPLNPVQNSNPDYDPGTQTDPNPNKNPKKRTRASRRAPTTVMTTDTANFRRMVQQYTGIPDSPFATLSPASGFTRRSDILRPAASYLNSGSNLQIYPSESYNIIKPHPNLSSLNNNNNNNMFSLQTFPPLQVNVTEVMGNSDPFVSSSSMKRWRGQDENFGNFEGRNGNSQNVVVSNVSIRNDDEDDDGRLPGNEDSWICPSD